MILSPDFISPGVLYISVLPVAIIFIARYISVLATGRITGKKIDDKGTLFFMIPGGSRLPYWRPFQTQRI